MFHVKLKTQLRQNVIIPYRGYLLISVEDRILFHDWCSHE